MSMRTVIVFLFVAMLCALWLPFHEQSTLYGTRSSASVPAGPIASDFDLTQTVRPAIDENVPLSPRSEPCFAIRFATYARTNAGQFAVTWRQGQRSARWNVQAEELADNAFRYFCPDADFDIREPFELRIKGVDGRPSTSATLWLVGDTHLGTASLGNRKLKDKGMSLKVSMRSPVGPLDIWRVDHGAFVLGWLCTLAIGLVTLVFMFRRR